MGDQAEVCRLLFGNRKLPLPRVLCVHRASGRSHWPVVFCDASPEDPYADHCGKGEERFEEAAIDGAFATGADVYLNSWVDGSANVSSVHRRV